MGSGRVYRVIPTLQTHPLRSPAKRTEALRPASPTSAWTEILRTRYSFPMPTTALQLNRTDKPASPFKLRWVVIEENSQPDTDLSSRDELFESVGERFDRGRPEAAREILEQGGQPCWSSTILQTSEVNARCLSN